ncbi:putative wd40 protein [Aspergillus granulosus]|uniref:Wd40 protein n=1 Tax=Aspergillus granulosus TaxID=176169 RepID=A0ABR4GWD1_9EURO
MAIPTLEEYQIGWICALPVEAAAAQEMLDENFGTLEKQDNSDTNIYTLGRIGKHFVAIACLGGQYGTTSATTVANNMMRTFSNSLRFGLMVGIGGGIPSAAHDIRLGDIVVSYPTGTCGGVVQHDMGKIGDCGKFTRTGSLNSPPRSLLAAVNQMRAAAFREDPLYPAYIQQAIERNTRTRRNFSRPDQQFDRFFQTRHRHPSNAATCDGCLPEWEVERDARYDSEPQLFYGIVASGNSVVKDGKTRDRLRRKTGALCFEMEAAGLMQDFPCIVIRGICDYADSHKNKQWQGYAALAAASYTKELLSYVPRGQVLQEQLVTEISSLKGELKILNQTTKHVEQKIDLQGLSVAKGAAFNSYENQHEECLEGTRVELLHDIEEWATSPAGKCIFWLSGKAGTGKSTISRTIASLLKEKGLLGASFFFKRGEEDRSSGKKLFPTLVSQLVNSIPQLRPFIQEAIKDDPQISEKVLGEQFKKLLLQPLLKMEDELAATTTTTTRVIVIDALDECEQDTDVQLTLRHLPQVKKSSIFRLRFLLTSREELPIRLGFQSITGEHQDLVLHDIPPSIIERDISMFLHHKLGKIRRKLAKQWCELPPDWPGNQCIKTLITMSVPLFIFAATVCRILEDPQWPPSDSLREILSHQNSKSNLDGTYLPVLNRLLLNQNGARKIKLIQEYQMLIGTILILETPLPARSLSKLADIPTESVSLRLDSLHAVLSIPDDEAKPVRLFHLSFRDFLLDIDTRDKTPLWINEKEMHGTLTNRCLELMRGSLRKNICKLPGDGTRRSDIDISSVDRHLSPELRYACCYWSQHLVQGQNPASALKKAFKILKAHFLHWVEAMSILGLISEVVGAINRLQSYTQNTKKGELLGFLNDAKRFVLKNRQIAEIAPLQLYSSGLMFCPRNSVIRELFKNQLSNWHQLPRVKEEWSAELQTLEGHSNEVNSVTFSPDGQLLASGSGDKTIKLWDPNTGELRQTLKGHSGWVTSVTFSPDGQLLASGSFDKTIKLWDPNTGELYQTLKGHSNEVNSVTFSPNGQLLASGSKNKIIKLWDPNTGELRQTLKGHSGSVNSVTFSPDGQLLASGSEDKTIKLWDPNTGKLRQTLEGHSNSVTFVAFSPDGQLLASGSEDRTINLWDPNTGELRQTLNGYYNWVTSVAFSPDGQLLASGSEDKTIKLWDPNTGELRQTLEGHSNSVTFVAFSPDGQLLASGSEDKTIKLWDPSTGELHQTLEEYSIWIRSMSFSPNGQLLASGSLDKTIKLWDPSTGKLCRTLKGHSGSVNSVTFSPNGQLLASGSKNKTIKLWDPNTGELRQTLEGHSNEVNSVTFSPNGQLLASGSEDKAVKLWDPNTGELHQTLRGHYSWVTSVTFSPDGQLLASGSLNNTIKLWDPSTGELRQTLEGHSHWVWTENIAVSIQDHQWICLQGKRILWLPTDYRPECVAFNGNVLALGDINGRISFISYNDYLLN